MPGTHGTSTRVAATGPKAEGAGAALAPDSQFPLEAPPTPPSHASAHAAPTTSPRSAHVPGESIDSDTRTQSDFADHSRGTTPAGTSNASQPSADELHFAATFGRIVSILMRSVAYKHYALTDLEWLVLPPMHLGQCAVMEAIVNGRRAPVAVALWAGVSDEVDKRLSENLNIPIKLRPDEWRSGNVLWLIDAVGDGNAIPHLLRHVQEMVFKARDVKMRTLDANGRLIVRLLNAPEQANESLQQTSMGTEMPTSGRQ